MSWATRPVCSGMVAEDVMVLAEVDPEQAFRASLPRRGGMRASPVVLQPRFHHGQERPTPCGRRSSPQPTGLPSTRS